MNNNISFNQTIKSRKAHALDKVCESHFFVIIHPIAVQPNPRKMGRFSRSSCEMQNVLDHCCVTKVEALPLRAKRVLPVPYEAPSALSFL